MPQIAYLFLNDDISDQIISRWCRAEDHSYASKFKRLHRQRQSLAGRALLRMLWAVKNSPHKCTLNIDTASAGALKLKGSNGEKPWGSIAHSHDFVCAGICDQTPIGIDCEKNDPNRDLHKIFSFLSLSNDLCIPTSLRTWVELEAFGKAMGVGLSKEAIHNFTKLKTEDTICSTYFEIENYGLAICLPALNKNG